MFKATNHIYTKHGFSNFDQKTHWYELDGGKHDEGSMTSVQANYRTSQKSSQCVQVMFKKHGFSNTTMKRKQPV